MPDKLYLSYNTIHKTIKRLAGEIIDSGFDPDVMVAIGTGGWFGTGLGGSVQKLFYLPESHTDFLFAVLSEELGFVALPANVVKMVEAEMKNIK